MARKRRPLLVDLAIGAAAGAIATWAMDRVTTVLLEREPQEAKDRENAARGDRTAYEIAADKGAELAGIDLDDARRARVASALHWSMGVAAGALYGALRNGVPRLGVGSGLGYGLVFWAAMDEGALTLLGLTPPPRAFPWQTHLRGLAGHLVLGAVIEAAFDLADGARRTS